MRYVIPNHEQTAFIKKRQPFGSRRLARNSYVYQGVENINGTYTVWHWSTRIAVFYPDGTVWLDHSHNSVTTSALRGRIIAAMTPDERIEAYQGIAREMHQEAESYPGLFHSKTWQKKLARYDWALDIPHTVKGA